MKSLRLALFLSLLAALLSFLGCGGGSHNSKAAAKKGRATFTVKWPARTTRLIPVASNSIQVIVQRNGTNVASQLLPRPVSGNTTSVTFDPLPVGNLTVTATAFPQSDGTGVAQATGATTIAIVAGQNTTVNLTMGSTITQVVVLPANPTLNFGNAPGNTVTLTASAMDANGNLVLTSPSTFTWNNFDSRELTVTTNGDMATVVGTGIGRSSITATETESNISGSDTLIVRGSSLLVTANGPKFRLDSQNTGMSGNNGGNGNALLWTFRANSQVESSPVIGKAGVIYIGSSDGNVYALNPDGSQRWASNIGGQVRCTPALGADESVYIGTTGGEVFCLDKNDGSRKWEQFFFGASFLSSPNIDRNGTIYLGSEDGKVFALDGSTGDQKWIFQSGGAVESSPALSIDGSVLYIGSGDRHLYALNTLDGSPKWVFSAGGSIKSSPTLSGTSPPLNAGPQVLFFGADDGKVYALNEADGSPFWTAPFQTGGAITSSPAVTILFNQAEVLIGSSDGKLYAINAVSGMADSSFQTGGSIRSSPTVTKDGNILIGSDDLKLYSLNLGDGLLLNFSFPSGGAVVSSPAVGPDGTVYFGSDDSQVYAVGQVL